MKSINKKIFILFLALAMLFTTCGCGKNNNESITTSSVENSETSDQGIIGGVVENIEGKTTSSSNESKTASTVSTVSGSVTQTEVSDYWNEMLKNIPSSLRGKEIKVYNWNSLDEYPGLANTIKKFTKETGIKVKWVREDYETYLSKLTSLQASGKNIPDIIRSHSPSPQQWVLCQDISASKFKDFKNKVWDQKFMSYFTVNGKVYATNTDASMMSGVHFLFYNKSLISKYNLDDPYQLWKQGKWILDKFEETMRTYNKATGKSALAGADIVGEYLSNIYGIEWGETKFDGKKFTSNLDNSLVIPVIQRVQNTKMKENLISGTWDLEGFDRGDVLFWAGTGVTAKRLNPYASTLKSAGSFGAVPYPLAPGESKHYSLYGDDGFAIPKGATYPEVFPYYVFYVTNKEHYDMNTYFPNNQTLEVFNYLTNTEDSCKRISLGWSGVSNSFYGSTTPSIGQAYKDVTGDQVPSALDANANLSKQRADEFNNILSKVGK